MKRMFKNALSIVSGIAIAGVCIQAVQNNSTGYTTEVNQKANDSLKVVKDYNVYALPLPKHIDFAGEGVPLKNPDIKERLDRELLVNTYWQSNGLLLFKRANKYFPIIEPILKKHGVPDDFKYLAVTESGLAQVVSPAGATGFWQLMVAAAKENGLEVNDNVDERYHIEKSTEAACEYIKDAKERFGNWTLAAAAYNAGSYGISKQQERQKVTNYYDLLLGDETERYVFRILAIKEILTHPVKYGFNFNKEDLYSEVPLRTIEVDTAVTNFANFAKNFGINYKILKRYNPWLRETFLKNDSKKPYEIKIPKEGYYSYTP